MAQGLVACRRPRQTRWTQHKAQPRGPPGQDTLAVTETGGACPREPEGCAVRSRVSSTPTSKGRFEACTSHLRRCSEGSVRVNFPNPCRGPLRLRGSIWQCLDTCLVVTAGVGMLPASGGSIPYSDPGSPPTRNDPEDSSAKAEDP